jgi:hypothetical protein
MVHALGEVWRVLKPAGIVIDLRPISVDIPLLILTATGWKSAGPVDNSPDRVHDTAANRAIRTAVHDRLFIRLKQEYFNVNYYWNDLKELRMDAEGRWKGDVIISKEIWQQARLLFKSGSGKKRIRIPFRKKLITYQKKFE